VKNKYPGSATKAAKKHFAEHLKWSWKRCGDIVFNPNTAEGRARRSELALVMMMEHYGFEPLDLDGWSPLETDEF
jgi:hypothetical protein